MKLPKLNIRMLAKVLKHVKEEPKRFNMGTFGYSINDEDRDNTTPPCGTQACIAGWAILLNKPKGSWKRVINNWSNGYSDPEKRAAKILGLTEEEGRSLFLTYLGQTGKTAIKTAEKKIALLKADREKFVKRYRYI